METSFDNWEILIKILLTYKRAAVDQVAVTGFDYVIVLMMTTLMMTMMKIDGTR